MSLLTACQEGDMETVKRLLTDPNLIENFNQAMLLACSYGKIKIVRLLLTDKRVDPSFTNNQAIRVASRDGQVKVVKLLLSDSRVDPSDNNNQAICWASSGGHAEVVRLLLNDHRVDPSVNDNWPIYLATLNGRIDIVRFLLADYRVNKKKEMGIRIQRLSGFIEIVKLNKHICLVSNGNPDTIKFIENSRVTELAFAPLLSELKEEYIKWQYRIGGEKYNTSLESLGITQSK